MKKHTIHTLAVTAGHTAPSHFPVPGVPAIVPAVGFIHENMEETDQALGSEGGSPDDPSGYIYARHGAPTQAAFEEAVAALEGAESAVSLSSGMATLHAAFLSVLSSGQTVVAARQLYGATRTMLGWLAEKTGIKVEYVDFLDTDIASDAIRSIKPAVVMCEVLTNPLARVVALDEIGKVAKDCNALLIVDNTFATPFLLRPLEYGADLVVHSTTKFLNGHGDVLGGVVSGASERVAQVRKYRRMLGAMPGAFDAWLALRGLRTLAVRLEHACRSATKIASWLATQPVISRVWYPGLPSDESNPTAERIFREGCFGALVAFELKDADRKQAFRLVDQLKIIHPITSLGDVNSLISHPATSSHRGLSAQELAAQYISEGTLRLSVGIEDPDDLIGDLQQALSI